MLQDRERKPCQGTPLKNKWKTLTEIDLPENFVKDYIRESNELRELSKCHWETIIEMNGKRAIRTPNGTFIVTEDCGGRTTSLTRIDHLPKDVQIKTYFDFFSEGLLVSRP